MKNYNPKKNFKLTNLKFQQDEQKHKKKKKTNSENFTIFFNKIICELIDK